MPAFYIFFYKHDQEADQQQPAADPYGALPEMGRKHTAHDGSHRKYADNSVIADTFIAMVLLARVAVPVQVFCGAAQISDAHGGGVGASLDFPEGIDLKGAYE